MYLRVVRAVPRTPLGGAYCTPPGPIAGGACYPLPRTPPLLLAFSLEFRPFGSQESPQKTWVPWAIKIAANCSTSLHVLGSSDLQVWTHPHTVLQGWLRGLVVSTCSASTLGKVTTWMGDCLLTGKPSPYVTNHLGQLSLPFLPVTQPIVSKHWRPWRLGGLLNFPCSNHDHVFQVFVTSWSFLFHFLKQLFTTSILQFSILCFRVVFNAKYSYQNFVILCFYLHFKLSLMLSSCYIQSMFAVFFCAALCVITWLIDWLIDWYYASTVLRMAIAILAT